MMRTRVLLAFLLVLHQVISQQNCYGGSIVKTVVIGTDGGDEITVQAGMDSNGKIIATGYTTDAVDLANSTWPDHQLGQFDIWITYTNLTDNNPIVFAFGGTTSDTPNGATIAKDTKDLCITGQLNSQNFPKLLSLQSGTPVGGQDVFFNVFNSSGSVPSNSTAKVSALFGGLGTDVGMAIDCKSNIAYIAGQTTSSVFDSSSSPDGIQKIFVTKFNISTGELLYNDAYGSNSATTAKSVSVYQINQDTLLAVTGFTSDPSFVLGGYQPNLAGADDAFLLILNVTDIFTIQYFTYFGGLSSDQGSDVATDANGFVLIVGSTSSSDLVCSGQYANNSDIFLAVFSPNGSLAHCRFFGAENDDVATAFDLQALMDGTILVVMTGYTTSLNFPLVAPFQNNSNVQQGTRDMFLMSYKLASGYTNGNVTFSTYLGTNQDDTPHNVQLLPTGRIVLSGGTYGSNFLGSNHTNQNPSFSDAVIVVMDCPALVGSPSPVPSHTASSHGSTKNGSNLGLIIGVVVGGVAAVMIASAIIVIVVKRKRSSHSQHSKTQPSEPRHKEYHEMDTGYALSPSANATANNSADTVHYVAISTKTVASAPERMSKEQDWSIEYPDLVIDKEIGKGAFGIVYKGKWRGVEVAVKQLLNADPDSTATQDFLAEAKLMTKLRPHPNITQTLGVCTEPLCLVTEFVHNGSLLDALKKNKIHPDNLVNVARGVAAGMFYLHGEGVIHRDLAARNILLDKTWSAKVSDFGMSRVAFDSNTNKTASDVGPIRWMAPEAMSQRVYNQKTDVWSYGVVLYELLTRTVPYQKCDLMQVATSVMTGNLSLLPEIEARKNEFPAIIVEVMRVCLQFNPADRPSFADIVDMYDKWSQ